MQSWPWVYFISDAVTDCSEMSPCPLINTSPASIKMQREGLWPYYFPLYVNVCKEDNFFFFFFNQNQLELSSHDKMNHIKLKSLGLEFQRIWTQETSENFGSLFLKTQSNTPGFLRLIYLTFFYSRDEEELTLWTKHCWTSGLV